MILFVGEVCPWCEVLLEKLLELKKQIPIEIKEINIDDPKWKHLKEEFMISGVPTLITFTDRSNPKKYVGIPDDDELQKMVLMAFSAGSNADEIV